MAFPGAKSATDRPAADAPATPAPGAQQQDTPPLVPAEQGQSPWWSAPAGKPFGIPDFAHEFLARVAAFASAGNTTSHDRTKAGARCFHSSALDGVGRCTMVTRVPLASAVNVTVTSVGWSRSVPG